MFNSSLTPSSSHIFSPCIVATTFLLCFMFRNSRNQTPCQVPVASFPFDMGTLTLAPIRDDLMCACPVAQSAIRLHEEISGSRIPACHRSPLHRAYRSPSQLPMHPVSQKDPMTPPSPPPDASLLPPSSSCRRTFIFLHHPVQRIAHVRPHIVVPVLIHRQRTARVLQE